MPASDQGIFHDRYQIIPRVLIFITRGREVLLIKGAPEKQLWANLYNGVGGHVEQGENVLSAAYRELQEETGITEVSLLLTAIIAIDTGERTGIGLYVFRGSLDEESVVELKPSTEGTLEWIHQFDMVSIPLVEDLPILIPRVLAHKAGDQPLYASYSYSSEGKLQIQYVKSR
jgi:8-oxo-dGTP diphosphatase